ncbi:MAG: hypothetical protein AB7I37_20195 [Pirellulales bacterium]
MPSRYDTFDDMAGDSGPNRHAPRVFQPHEPADLPVPEEWPADLEALAEQLSDDARFLAERYPAPTRLTKPKSVGSAIVSKSPGHAIRRFAAVIALCLIGGASLSFWRLQPSGDLLPSRQMTRVPVETAAGATLPANMPDVTPTTVGFQDLTPPEQEAVLDLLEGDDELMRLSI